MRRYLKLLMSILVIASFASASTADAAFFSLPRTLGSQIDHVSFQSVVMGPFAYTNFCTRYADDCREHGRAFRQPRAVTLTPERWADLIEINQRVNRSITPHPYINDTSYDTWRINPTQGDCNDYAVSKRHELLARGWPSRALLLGEVVTRWGEHHLVLVVRTATEDFVLDNLNANIKIWSRTPYRWVRIQSPTYRGLWATIQQPTNSYANL